MQLRNAADFEILFFSFLSLSLSLIERDALDALIRDDKAMTKPDFRADSHTISECVRLRSK